VLVAHLEALQCPAAHEASPLIAAVRARVGDDVRDATLGCPTCGAEYDVRDGWAVLGGEIAPAPAARPGDDDLMRAGALLGLTTPGGAVALAPAWAEYAHPLAALTDVTMIVVAPPPGFTTGDGVSAVAGTARVPLRSASCRAVALDAWVAAQPQAVAAWVSATRAGGRVVAPTQVPVPDGVRELARDARHWVGERHAVVATAPVALRRGGR
jgi:uncharacterized protein YbaR (Trm112 family)